MPRRGGGSSGSKKRRPGANRRTGSVAAEAEQLFFNIQELQEKLQAHREQQQQQEGEEEEEETKEEEASSAGDPIQVVRRQHYLKRFDGPTAPKSWDIKALREDFAILQSRCSGLHLHKNNTASSSGGGGAGAAQKRARRGRGRGGAKAQSRSASSNQKAESPSSHDDDDEGLDSFPSHVLALVLDFLPAGTLARCRRLNSHWKLAADHVITKVRGYTQANDGLLTEFLLRTVLAPAARPGPERDATINRILTAVVQYGGQNHGLQWVLWGDDATTVVKSRLASFFFQENDGVSADGDDDEEEEEEEESEQLPYFNLKRTIACGGCLDEDDAIGISVSERLRDSSPGARFGHKCYAEEVQAALKARDKLPATANAHGSTCGACGGKHGSDATVLFCADVAGQNLCVDCLNATTVARVHCMLAHPGVFFFSSKVPTGPFPIPERLKGTEGTREGVFFSPGAQHTCFGIELWANPVFVPAAVNDVHDFGEPPNAYDIVEAAGLWA